MATSPVLTRQNPAMNKSTKQTRLLSKEQKRLEKQAKRLAKQALRQELKDEKDKMRRTQKVDAKTSKNNREARKKKQIQLLNNQLTLLTKIKQIQAIINNEHRCYLNPKIVDILDENVLNSLTVLNKLKPSNLDIQQQSEYLIIGWIKHNKVSSSLSLSSSIKCLLLKFYGYCHRNHTMNAVNSRQRIRLIQKLTHQTNTNFKQMIVNKITSTYPMNKKMHRDLKKILKQYQKSMKRMYGGSRMCEQYTLIEVGDTQICYEKSDFPVGFPIFFLCDVQNAAAARFSIVASLFKGMGIDFGPQAFRWCLDKFPICSNGIIQFYEKPCGLPVVEEDKSLIVYYKGVNIVNNGRKMDENRINALIDYKINSCFLENKFIVRDKTRHTVIWSYLFNIKQYFEYYQREIFDQYFPSNYCPYKEIIGIIKSFCWQNISFLFKNYNDKILILWFLHFENLNDEWLQWIGDNLLYNGSILREKLSFAIEKYETWQFVLDNIRNKRLLMHLLNILCSNVYENDIDNFLNHLEILDYDTIKYLINELSNNNYNYHKFIEKLLDSCCIFECCLYAFIINVEPNKIDYVNTILAVYTPTALVIDQMLNAAILNKIKSMKIVLNIMSCLIKSSKENMKDIDWALFINAVLLYTTFKIDTNLMQLILNTTVKYKVKCREDTSIFQYVFLEHICKTKIKKINNVQNCNLKLFFRLLIVEKNSINEKIEIMKDHEFDINIGILYCCEFGTDSILALLLNGTSLVNYSMCKERGYLQHVQNNKSSLSVVATEILNRWFQNNGDSFSPCIVM